ncbi:RNA polymerase sigma factor [Micromonospora sp. WMMD967]|uniref:RNA polymerase sigma factor n=1 Tax=Micromonospora sp. WMMD967 TaxID=3016101 RepID=UPI0024171EBA|nr:RNA polymerase sigma factor [Micromonospora sp. WMMD967]MDG4840945.1 RNA polymerase sigma factor [Micromonospora sp. WMMD967]
MTGVEGTAALTPEPVDSEVARRAEAARLKAEHDREFATFAEDSYHTVEGILRAACWNREVVQDALNEAYLHGRVQWPKIRAYAEPIGWVIITARNKIRKELQRRQREAAFAPEDLPPAPHTDISDVWEAQEMLRSWLHRLPSRQAEVFQMSRKGFSNQDIARILGLAENSVRSYKLAARKRLQELAEEAGYTASEGRRRQGGSRGPR